MKLKRILENLMGIWYEPPKPVEPKPETQIAIPKDLERFINPYEDNVQEFGDRYEGEIPR